MSAIVSRVRGRLRLARGRCPACASEAAEGCGVCLGHQRPFPVEPAQLRRWAARFEASLGTSAALLGASATPGDVPRPRPSRLHVGAVPIWTPGG